MSTRKQRFQLSPQGTLRQAIAGLLLLPPLALANGITGADGPGGTPQLHSQGGVPVVNIVAPNGAGLSHNQFLDYNVERQGVVLNNAVQAGQSQLAGQLGANPQFHSQAASVILNEVIGRNASALNGAQEVFGRQADYVLANPNGISVNGASFINAPNASLVVGRPELDNGRLQALNTDNARGQLSVQEQGLDNPQGSIHLIAPQFDSQGPISARDALNLTVGRNRLDADSGRVSTVYPAGEAEGSRIDANLFGAMKAGRINIVSTAEGAGVRMGAIQVAGTDGVSIRSAGDLQISGQTHLNSLDASRAEVLSSNGDVDLQGARDVNLAGADIGAGNVRLDAGRNLTLSSLQSTALQEKRDQWNHKALFVTYETFDRTLTDQDSREHGTRVTARHNAALASGADTLLKASVVEAGDRLSINSGADLRLAAATESHEVRDQGNHRKHLWKENWDTTTREQRTVSSRLKAGKTIELGSGKKLQVEGAELNTPGDIQLDARQVEISSVSRTQSKSGKGYSGDLVGGSFFARHGDGESDKTLHTGSQVNAGGKLMVKADDVHISASQVRGGTQASVLSDSGSLVIDGVHDTSRDSSHNTDSKLFALIKDESRKDHSDRTIVASELHSDSNLRLQSARDIIVSGSKVSAAGDSQVQAKGDIKIVAAANTATDSTRSNNRGFTANARETAAGSREYRVDVGYKGQQQTSVTDTTRQQGASLSGGALAISAGGDLNIKGSELSATAGDVNLQGKNINLLAAHNSTQVKTQSLSNSGGIVWTASLDKAGSGLEYVRQSSEDSSNRSTATTSNVAATGNVRVLADNALVTQGSRIDAGSGLQVNALRVDNQAAYNSESSQHTESGWQAGLGVSVEIKGLTKPIESALANVVQGKPPQDGLLDGVALASVGLDTRLAYNTKNRTQQDSSARVSQLSGDSVQVKVNGKLQDQGTHYRATGAGLNINAGSHEASAAIDTHKLSEQGWAAGGDLRVYTTTGEDVNARVNASGAFQRSQEAASTSHVGRYDGAQGVTIQTRGDARYAGGAFDGGAAGVRVESAGQLALNQAADTRSQSAMGLSAKASLKLETAGGNKFSPGGSLKFDQPPRNSQSSQAQLVTLRGDGQARLTGARVDGDVLLGAGKEPQSLSSNLEQSIN